jgi:tetratricopeptide (TPR) repeat protein
MQNHSANPYKPNRPAGEMPEFTGRLVLLREVMRTLRSPKEPGVLLYGQRRIGKTSILRELLCRLPKKPTYHPVYFDLLDKASWPPGDILRALAREISRRMGQPLPDLGQSPLSEFVNTWLPEFLESLPPRHMLILLLDEFGVLVDPRNAQASAQLFPILRNLLNLYTSKMKFVAVISRNLHELDMAALDFSRGIKTLQVSLLNHAETAQLVRYSECEGSLSWTPEAIEAVWMLTSGHPLMTQQICAEVWNDLHESGDKPGPATDEDVENAIIGALENGRNSLEWLWNGLPSAARVVIAALAEAGARPITHDELLRVLGESGVHVVIRELEEAPRMLQEWDVIEPGEEPYRFRVELLRRWVQINKPLDRVKEELDYIEPLAENLYQAAARMFQHRRPDQAVALLRQAVETNPNHERASMLLADILSTMGHPDQALEILERLYLIRPFAIWPRLTRVLLEKARLAASEDIQLELFQRILEVEPLHPEAQQGKQGIWRRRAEAALAANKIDEAQAAYREAGMPEQAERLEQRLRRQLMERSLHELRQLERNRNYQQALELTNRLSQEYPDYDWEPVLTHFQGKAELIDMYERGLAALDLGDRAKAAHILAEVALENPRFNEVTRYLHIAATGIDVTILQRDLNETRQALREAQQALQSLQVQLTSFGQSPAVSFPAPPLGTFNAKGMEPATKVENPQPAWSQTGGLLHAISRMTTSTTHSGELTRDDRLRQVLVEARLGHGRIVGLPDRVNCDAVEIVERLTREEGLLAFTGNGHTRVASSNYSAWRGALQSLFAIDSNLPIDLQVRQLRTRLTDIDEAYLTFLPKFSLVVLDTPIPGMTALKLMGPQEVQATVQAIIIARIRQRAGDSPVLLLLKGNAGLDRLSRDLLVNLDDSIESLPMVVALSYPDAYDALDDQVRKLGTFTEI